MNIYEILDEIEHAYPEDIFPDTTQGERDDVIERYPGFIDRTSAMMGRHLAKVIRHKLEDKDEDEADGAGELFRAAEDLYRYMSNDLAQLLVISTNPELHKLMLALHSALKIREGEASKPSFLEK